MTVETCCAKIYLRDLAVNRVKICRGWVNSVRNSRMGLVTFQEVLVRNARTSFLRSLAVLVWLMDSISSEVIFFSATDKLSSEIRRLFCFS